MSWALVWADYKDFLYTTLKVTSALQGYLKRAKLLVLCSIWRESVAYMITTTCIPTTVVNSNLIWLTKMLWLESQQKCMLDCRTWPHTNPYPKVQGFCQLSQHFISETKAINFTSLRHLGYLHNPIPAPKPSHCIACGGVHVLCCSSEQHS